MLVELSTWLLIARRTFSWGQAVLVVRGWEGELEVELSGEKRLCGGCRQDLLAPFFTSLCLTPQHPTPPPLCTPACLLCVLGRPPAVLVSADGPVPHRRQSFPCRGQGQGKRQLGYASTCGVGWFSCWGTHSAPAAMQLHAVLAHHGHGPSDHPMQVPLPCLPLLPNPEEGDRGQAHPVERLHARVCHAPHPHG